jgi:hypothetical protein
MAGRRLDRVLVEWHRFAGRDNAMTRLWLVFSGDELGLECDSSAEGLELATDGPKPDFGMDEYGEIVTRDSSSEQPFAPVINGEFMSVRNLRVPRQVKPLGVVLRFRPIGKLVIVNWGDDLLVEAEVPAFILAESPDEID